jgi:hypothetical protein
MSRIRTALVGTVAAGLLLMSAGAASASEPVVETKHDNIALDNNWWLESSTEITTVRDTTETYKSQIQQPINPDNTSTWPAKRGVIPVQFKLAESSKTVQTVTKVPSFKSIGSDGFDPNTDWSALTHVPPTGTKVEGITNLTSHYAWVTGTNHGGSLRWVINASGGPIWAHHGSYPNFTDNAVPGSGDNLISQSDLRFDASSRGGPTYATWNDIKNLYGSEVVGSVALTIDGGWGGDQEIDLFSATVNGSTVGIQDSYTSTETLSEVVGATTNEPTAHIEVVKVNKDGTPIDVMETPSSAQGDTDGQFRQIDGKYMYNLKAETLGSGNFQVFMVVDGYGKVENLPGVFELR